MKKVDDFVISVGMSKKQNSVASQIANLQMAILEVYEQHGSNKKTNKLCKEFSKLKRLMYGSNDD